MVPVFRMGATKGTEMMTEALEHECGAIFPGEDPDLSIGPPRGPGVWGWGWGQGRGNQREPPVTLWYHSWLQRDMLPGNQPERQRGEIM